MIRRLSTAGAKRKRASRVKKGENLLFQSRRFGYNRRAGMAKMEILATKGDLFTRTRQADENCCHTREVSVAEIEDKRLTAEQYEQLHEMRREYNRFIFQAPTIVVAVVAGTLAFLGQGGSAPDLIMKPTRLAPLAEILMLLAGFILVIGYWAFRSQILLRQSEKTLKQMENAHGHPEFVMFPFELRLQLTWWKRLPSTLFIVIYILFVGVTMLVIAGFAFYLRIFPP